MTSEAEMNFQEQKDNMKSQAKRFEDERYRANIETYTVTCNRCHSAFPGDSDYSSHLCSPSMQPEANAVNTGIDDREPSIWNDVFKRLEKLEQFKELNTQLISILRDKISTLDAIIQDIIFKRMKK